MMARAWVMALSLAAPASAAKKPACGQPDAAGVVPVLSEVLECQQRARQAFAERRRKKTGRGPTPDEQDRFDDFQRAQMRAYMEAHPKEATIDGERESRSHAPPPTEEKGILERLGAVRDKFGLKKPDSNMQAGPKASPTAEAEARQTIGGVKDGATMAEVDLGAVADEARQDPEGTLKRTILQHKKQFDTNVPDEVKGFYKKPGD